MALCATPCVLRAAQRHTDLARLRAGGVGGQFWSVYIPGEGSAPFARMQLEQIDLARRVIERYPEALQLAGTAAQMRAAFRRHRIGSMLGIEGGHAIENSLRAYYALGVRYLKLTHNTHTDWADSAAQLPPRLVRSRPAQARGREPAARAGSR